MIWRQVCDFRTCLRHVFGHQKPDESWLQLMQNRDQKPDCLQSLAELHLTSRKDVNAINTSKFCNWSRKSMSGKLSDNSG